ncbi:hypothetical protein [Providencia phage PSTRCR_127]|nr:hypothetical protein [Providencia phage PSTRCR_127]
MNLYAENMKYVQNHMDEKAEYHKEFEYHSDRLLYEFRFVNLNYGRQTGKSRGIAEFMAHEKIKNPKRDIILASYRAAMWDDIKRNYRNHCLEYGLVPTKNPMFTSFGGNSAKRAVNNGTWWNQFRGLNLIDPIFIFDEPMDIDPRAFLDKFVNSCHYTGLPTFYIIGSQ